MKLKYSIIEQLTSLLKEEEIKYPKTPPEQLERIKQSEWLKKSNLLRDNLYDVVTGDDIPKKVLQQKLINILAEFKKLESLINLPIIYNVHNCFMMAIYYQLDGAQAEKNSKNFYQKCVMYDEFPGYVQQTKTEITDDLKEENQSSEETPQTPSPPSLPVQFKAGDMVYYKKKPNGFFIVKEMFNDGTMLLKSPTLEFKAKASLYELKGK